jgi:hypothetical protein
MNRTTKSLSRAVIASAVAGAAVAAICFTGTPAEAQYAPPPAEVIATLAPVYHEGRATYWYNGYWHYRDHGAWSYYHEEPAFLRDWRGHHQAYYHHYGRR